MADALEANVRQTIYYESLSAHTQHMSELKATRGVTNGALRASAVKQYDEPGVIESMGVRKVLDLPIT